MNRLITILAFSIIAFFSTCSKKINLADSTPLSSISLQSLTAINLSEDMNEVSTKEDEILLLTFLIDTSDAKLQIIKQLAFEHTFTAKAESIELNTPLNFKDIILKNKELVFILVELDNNDSVASVKQLITQAISQQTQLANIDDRALNKLIGHDDLLDIQYLNPRRLTKNSPFKIKFSGLQLFDRFEYRLQLIPR